MKRVVLIYGTVLGTILCINMVYLVNLFYNHPDFKSNEILGYAGMVVVFSLIYFGVRNYRNKQLNGVISLGKAFQTGALIALIGSTMYVVVWMFYYHFFAPDFIERYISHVLKDVPAAELEAKTKEMQGFQEMYKNPFFAILMTYAEVLPIGLVVAFIISLILKKKPSPETSSIA